MVELVHRPYETSDGYWVGDKDNAQGKRVLVLWLIPHIDDAAADAQWPWIPYYVLGR